MDLLTHHLRLSDLNEVVAGVFDLAFPGPFWVIAEVASVTYSAAGHTYIDLVEKRGDEIMAQSRAQLWSSRREALARFERATRSKLERGMQVLVLARPVFHRRYGYGLEIQDIDASYTLGDMAQKRQEVIDRLTDAGLIDRNRGLSLSPAPLRVAVISSATAAGWEDFSRCLARNAAGYTFSARLFPALMQGDGAERSVLNAFRQISRIAHVFDCVVILRGGGATVDLSCFDSLEMGRVIAQSPLPVICGIGHERDVSVCDLAAYHAAPTPTAAAEFLIARVAAFEAELDAFAESILHCTEQALAGQLSTLQNCAHRVIATAQRQVRSATTELQTVTGRCAYAVRTSVAIQTSELSGLAARAELLPGILIREMATEFRHLQRDLRTGTHRTVERIASELTLLEREIAARDPAEILRSGYSITRVGGRVIRDAGDAMPGTRIDTMLHRGRITSIVDGTVPG